MHEQAPAYLQVVTTSAALENFEATTLQHQGITNLKQENLNSWHLCTGSHCAYYIFSVSTTNKLHKLLLPDLLAHTQHYQHLRVHSVAISLSYRKNASARPYSWVHY